MKIDRPFINKIHFAVKWLNYVNKLFTIKIYDDNLKYINAVANYETVSEPVCLADRRSKGACRSQIIILLRS